MGAGVTPREGMFRMSIKYHKVPGYAAGTYKFPYSSYCLYVLYSTVQYNIYHTVSYCTYGTAGPGLDDPKHDGSTPAETKIVIYNRSSFMYHPQIVRAVHV